MALYKRHYDTKQNSCKNMLEEPLVDPHNTYIVHICLTFCGIILVKCHIVSNLWGIINSAFIGTWTWFLIMILNTYLSQNWDCFLEAFYSTHSYVTWGKPKLIWRQHFLRLAPCSKDHNNWIRKITSIVHFGECIF